MITAIYRRREDGDYDFVAAFNRDEIPVEPSNWPREVVDWLESENEEVLVVDNVDLDKLPMTWKGA
jgi:hypothetical protein